MYFPLKFTTSILNIDQISWRIQESSESMIDTLKNSDDIFIEIYQLLLIAKIKYSRFAVRKVQTKKLVLGNFHNIGHLKVLNDTKLILDD